MEQLIDIQKEKEKIEIKKLKNENYDKIYYEILEQLEQIVKK